MTPYTVYRFDYTRQVREPIGYLMERRSKERGNNAVDLLRLAQRIYSTSSLDSHIGITPETPPFPRTNACPDDAAPGSRYPLH